MRFRLVPLIAAVLLSSFLPAAVAAAGPNAKAESRAEVLAFWTPERMKSAKWLDVQFDAAAGEGRLVPRSTFTPPSNTSSASWGANINDEMTRATGRVYFQFTKGSAYICSGTVVKDTRTGYSTVLTAAHCVYDQKSGKFASKWLYIPAFDVNPTYTCASTALGCWNAVAIVTRTEFTSSKRLTSAALQHDWAFVVVAGGGKTGTSAQLDVTVSLDGSATGLALGASEAAPGTVMTAIGYPAASPYNGNDLTYCQNPVYRDSGQSNTTYKMACLMTGGSSGGPWVIDAGSGYGATLRSLNSYGYTNDTNMYGPIFGTDTQKTFDRAQEITSGTVAISTN